MGSFWVNRGAIGRITKAGYGMWEGRRLLEEDMGKSADMTSVFETLAEPSASVPCDQVQGVLPMLSGTGDINLCTMRSGAGQTGAGGEDPSQLKPARCCKAVIEVIAGHTAAAAAAAAAAALPASSPILCPGSHIPALHLQSASGLLMRISRKHLLTQVAPLAL
eukprot:138732-Pelagomonas_calceolata.AAC.3